MIVHELDSVKVHYLVTACVTQINYGFESKSMNLASVVQKLLKSKVVKFLPTSESYVLIYSLEVVQKILAHCTL